MPLRLYEIKRIDILIKYNVFGEERVGAAIRTCNGMQLLDAIGNPCKKQTVALMGMLRNDMLQLQHHCRGDPAKGEVKLLSPDLKRSSRPPGQPMAIDPGPRIRAREAIA
jgi:hypothetical protein